MKPDKVTEYQLQLLQDTHAGHELHHDRVYVRLLSLFQKAKGSSLQYMLEEKRVCRKFWLHCNCVGMGTVQRMMLCCKAGHQKLPPKEKRNPRGKTSFYDADEWFLHLYKHFAEPFATPGSGETGQDEPHEVVEEVSHPLYSLSVCVEKMGDSQRTVPKRYLSFQTYAELWATYEADTDPVLRVSYSSLL